MVKLFLALTLLGLLGWADTLVLTDETVLEGRLVGLTATTLSFSVGGIPQVLPLERVTRITLDLRSDPRPRVEERQWSRALGQAQRAFLTCRYLRQGLVLAGFAFVGFGQWLNVLGYEVFGNMLTAFGGISFLWGVSMPPPGCEVPAGRLRALLYIGLEHGWLY